MADWRKKVQLENKKREIHSAQREIHSAGQLDWTKNTQQLPLTLDDENHPDTCKQGRKRTNKEISTFFVGNVLKYMIALEQVATLSI